MLIKEHLGISKDQDFDSAFSSFFKNYDSNGNNISSAAGRKIHCLKARSLIVDTEIGVINQIFKSPIADFFDRETQVVSDVSGAGNNWA